MRIFALVAALVLGGLLSGVAAAQYPSKPLRLICPFPAGGPADISARNIAAALSNALGQPVIVDNKAGADGLIAAQEVKRSPADGYTIFWGSASSLSYVPVVRKQPPYDPLTDFTPLTQLGAATFILTVHPSVNVTSARQLIDYLKANPGKLSYGSANTTSILLMAQLMVFTNSDAVHVPYRGEAQAIPDLAAGRIQFMYATPGPSLPLVKEGRLRSLAMALPQRSALAPDVPTIAEAGYPLASISGWIGFVAPAGLPADITQRLARELNAVLAGPEVRAQHDRLGFAIRSSSPAEFAKFMKEQLEIWRSAVREAKIPHE
jgi:tripartite-type tricarboxylate transporter receptor subunit TctC